MKLLSIAKSQPWAITVTTVLTAFAGIWLVLFALGVFGSLRMSFFEAIAVPMQLTVIGMGIFLMARLIKNRPESVIRSVPIPVRVIVPVAIAIGVLQMALLSNSMPTTSPAGNPVHSFDASIENGICTATFNGTEHVPELPSYCVDYQNGFNRIFAGGWLLFSALELWGAWAIYGSPPVQRIPPDRHSFQQAGREPNETSAATPALQPKSYLWLSLRILIIGYWAFEGWRGFGPKSPTIPGGILAFTAFWGAIATRFWIVQAYTSTKRIEPWLLPSWYANPFRRSQPFQFFHLAGLGFLAFGLVHLAAAVKSGMPLSLEAAPPEFFAGSFGLGILVGIYWAIASYRSRFSHVTEI